MITTNLLQNNNVTYQPTINAAPINISQVLLSNNNIIYQSSLFFTVLPNLLSNSSVVFNATIQVEIKPQVIINQSNINNHNIVPVTIQLQPQLIQSTETVFSDYLYLGNNKYFYPTIVNNQTYFFVSTVVDINGRINKVVDYDRTYEVTMTNREVSYG